MSSDQPHRIRLRKPWQVERLPHGLCWKRIFHRPTGLGHGDGVWIVVTNAQGSGSASLNGEPLGRLAAGRQTVRFDVTERLDLRNELVLDMDSPGRLEPAAAAAEPADVYLEISPGDA